MTFDSKSHKHPQETEKEMIISLDLGSGPVPKNPFGANSVIGVDLVAIGDSVLKCDLGFESLPFPDSYFDCCSAFDLLEHIPRSGGSSGNRNPFIFLMNEIWRVLKNDGKFYAQTPVYPFSTAFSDPTHVNIITTETVRFFATEILGDGLNLADDRLELGKRYGFNGRFSAIRNYTSQQFGHQIWLLVAHK